MDIYLALVIIAYLLVVIFGYWLDFLNLSHLKKYGADIPREFEGQIDQDLLSKTRKYTVENTKFEFATSVFHNIILLVFILALLTVYNSWIISLNYSFIVTGLIFFLLLSYADTILSVPFSLYSTFKIENRFGFNTMTVKLWITDTLKSLIISTILMALLISVGLYLIQKSPALWWLWVWSFFLVFGVFIMYISPYVIEPLFHKFSPIDNEELESEIKNLLSKAGIRVSRIFKVDASRRTKHTNAYFTGIGKTKRIVLYDTLIEKMNRDEILAVLAHEAGHWKKKHVLKHIVTTEVLALVGIYIAFHVLQTDVLIDLFAIKQSSLFVKLILLGFIGSIILFPFGPLFHLISRRHENEADKFSFEMTGKSEGMISALVKLSKDNLSNLHPHPLYALFHYSHPPVLERIRKIRGWSG